MSNRKFHGVEPRGLESTPRSTSFEGRFGRMFRTLPPAHHNEADLTALGQAMVADPENPPTSEDEIDAEENQGIDAGYTYFGQFIDHDLTFDPASSLQKQNDPNGLEDFRTPRFDLDNVYGRGPDDQPYIYADDGLHILMGRSLTGNKVDNNSKDLQRNEKERAIIGDPRNDENVIVSQFQATIIRFHNRVTNILVKKNPATTIADIQQCVRWHYQWVVLFDFLPTIVGENTLHDVLPHLKHGKSIYEAKPNLQFYKFKKAPFMPVEFSVAAYRFGHSMIRPIYRLNQTLTNRQFIFGGASDFENLVGFREFPSSWAIDWDLFFNPGNAPLTGTNRIQKAYKIDTSIVNPLGSLPPAVARNPSSLAERNLKRGLRMGLPSGQAVARQMHINPIHDKDLKVGKATEEDNPNNKTLVSISSNFKNNAPLWYYILAEAQQNFKQDKTPITLGPVGGRIVTEVFVGLLLGDNHTFLAQDPTWQPMAEFLVNGKFMIKDLLKQGLKDNEAV